MGTLVDLQKFLEIASHHLVQKNKQFKAKTLSDKRGDNY